MVRDDIYAFYEMRCHPDFLKLTPGLIKPFPSFRAAEAYMRWIDQAVARRAFVAWSVLHGGTGEYLGYVFMRRPMGFEAQPRLTLEFGIDPHHWGHRYGSEALTAMIPQAFTWPERILKIEGNCLAQNIPSIRTMERAGMRQVACLQEHYQHEGSIHDLCLFEIRRRELAM